MISTQRLLALVLILDIVILIATSVYNDPADNNSFDITRYSDNIQSDIEDITDDDLKVSGQETDNQYTENTPGNTFVLGGMIWDLLVRGINPHIPNDFTVEQVIEARILQILTYFVILINVIAILELFLLFKNNKAT